MKKLYVYYQQHQVGTLNQDEDLIYSFQYDPTWLNLENNFPLSLCLPLQQEAFGNRLSLSFFENLLPEGDAKKDIENHSGTKGVFNFLKKYGRDCAGAIIITPDKGFKYNYSTESLIEIDIQKINEAIRDRKSLIEIVAETNPGYLSLAGAQDKFPFIYKNKKFYLPTNNQPTTHILKAPIWRHGVYDSVYNEQFCLHLAKSVGLECIHSIVHQADHPLFICERYDRITDKNNQIIRLHQQDFCQALGVISENKYEKDGGPSLANNYQLILENITAKKRIKTIEMYIQWFLFNMIIGNNDGHSKNLSLLHKNNQLELAPFYDIICTAIYPKLSKTYAFKIGLTFDYFSFSKKHFHLQEKYMGIKENTLIKYLKEMVEKVSHVKDVLLKEYENQFPNIQVFEKINLNIDDRIKILKNQSLI
ncbi:MAG: type II toxin-antitoxin system HipA family toxin [Bdellovibrionales bacterium]|nr:type II toxin-antitoxin system HipA family toxin [Bdellovibrionales bacterium]